MLLLHEDEVLVVPDTRRCTALTMAVYTITSGDHPAPAALGQVQVGTALGVAVPPNKVRRCQLQPLLLASTSRSWCTGQGMTVPLGQHPKPSFTSFLHLSTSPL